MRCYIGYDRERRKTTSIDYLGYHGVSSPPKKSGVIIAPARRVPDDYEPEKKSPGMGLGCLTRGPGRDALFCKMAQASDQQGPRGQCEL